MEYFNKNSNFCNKNICFFDKNYQKLSEYKAKKAPVMNY